MSASRRSVLLSLFAICLFFGFSSGTPPAEASNQLIDTICSRTRNSEFCKSVLRSNPQADQCDMKELFEETISKAFIEARDSWILASKLLYSGSSQFTKMPLLICLVDYKAAMHKFKAIYKLSKLNQYHIFFKPLLHAIKVIEQCENACTNVPDIEDSNQHLLWLSDIALAVLEEIVR